MSQLALTLKNSTRRWTQLTFSSIVARRSGISAWISDARSRSPNSTDAEIRESVENGATVSGASGGLSSASAFEQNAINPSAASPARADDATPGRRRRMREVEVGVMTEYLVGLKLGGRNDRTAHRGQIPVQYAGIGERYRRREMIGAPGQSRRTARPAS